MKSKIYTLTGDNGTTSLIGGQRVDKDDVRVEAYGTIDELNANIGRLAHVSKLQQWQVDIIHKIQNKLFNIGAYLATPSDGKTPVPGLADDDVKELEARIDEIDVQLPPLHGFVLPGGSLTATRCDICRTVTRRAERRVVTLAKQVYVDPLVLRYLNRLSDFFFVFARFNNINEQIEELYLRPKAAVLQDLTVRSGKTTQFVGANMPWF